jgi:hypothetical protein
VIRALDSNNDFTWGAGVQNYLTGEAEINEDIATALKVFLGECFFATNFGVDWWNLIGSANLAGIILQCRTVIAARSGVTKITKVDAYLDRTKRALFVSYSVSTIYSLQTSNSVTIA